ncbi:pyroglutamyl-peptidase I [Dokdonella sp.]|uniref:pyroglutamyl-peptidase I n=1 Tax=Dokdonella sp. TaxID=2291710 RepID=UPI003C5639C0
MNVLILGFEPFEDETINPSMEIALQLDGEIIAGHAVVGAILPVTFTDAPAVLAELLDRHQPRMVIALGQAGGRAEMALERIAINLIDARIPDNSGLQPVDTPVLNGGPGAYFSSLPVKLIKSRLDALGIPCALSLSAGTFVCNQVFYWLCHLLETEHPSAHGGFIHVPWLPEQADLHPGQPAMPLESMVLGARAAIESALTTETDLKVPGGSTY